jgi:SAM-dependent methyltransferase
VPDLFSTHQNRLRDLDAFVAALPGVPETFRAKYRVLADPVLGARRTRLLEYELRVARCDPRGGTVLDAGAGTGIYSVMFALLGAERVEAIDFFPDNVHGLNEVATRFSLPIRAQHGDIAGTSLGAATVSLAYCTEAISHFHDWGAFLAEMTRVVRPGGRLIIADGNNGANPRVKGHILDFWEESETGPFTAGRFAPGKNLPYLFRRWAMIRRRFPEARDDDIFQLGLRTAGLGGDELIAACRSYFETGALPGHAYRRGMSQRRPEDGQRNEEPLDPRAIAGRLRELGFDASARAHFGYGRSPLLPLINAVGAALGSLALRLADRYLVIATKR